MTKHVLDNLNGCIVCGQMLLQTVLVVKHWAQSAVSAVSAVAGRVAVRLLAS